MTSHLPKPGHLDVQSDDIASLQHHLQDESFVYIDIAAAQAHEQVIRRWRLLSELHNHAADEAQSGEALRSSFEQVDSVVGA